MATIHILQYIQKALEKAEYECDENGIIISRIPNVEGFFAQGKNFEEARNNLADVIEGNIVIALQLGFPIPKIDNLFIKRVESSAIKHSSKVLEYA